MPLPQGGLGQPKGGLGQPIGSASLGLGDLLATQAADETDEERPQAPRPNAVAGRRRRPLLHDGRHPRQRALLGLFRCILSSPLGKPPMIFAIPGKAGSWPPPRPMPTASPPTNCKP